MRDYETDIPGIAQYFEPLIGAHMVQRRITRLSERTSLEPGVSAYFLYPAFEGGKPGIDALVRALKYEIPGFCTTKKDRARAKANDAAGIDMLETQMLIDRARSLFIKATGGKANSGEGGELLLFAFIEHFLRAPIILSKMRLKTSTQMPVHGSDGVHARWDSEGNRLVVIFGESKVYATLPDAMKSAAESVGTFANNIGGRKHHELQLTTDHIDLDGFPDQCKEALIRYLHPFATEEGSDREDRFAILLAYNSEAYGKLTGVASAKAEDAFIKHYKSKMAPALALAKRHLAAANVAFEQADLFILPMPNVQHFRDSFEEVLRA